MRILLLKTNRSPSTKLDLGPYRWHSSPRKLPIQASSPGLAFGSAGLSTARGKADPFKRLKCYQNFSVGLPDGTHCREMATRLKGGKLEGKHLTSLALPLEADIHKNHLMQFIPNPLAAMS